MFKGIYPIVIAESLQNLDQFSLPRGKSYRTYGPRLTRPWFIDNWYRRVQKRPFGYPARIIRKEGVSVVHAHFGHIGCQYLALSLSLRIPLITSFYGLDLSVKNLVERKRSDYAQIFKHGACFLIEGPFMCDKLISLGCPEKKIYTQRIAIDLDQYTFRSRSWDKKRRIRILFVGRFTEKKGLEYALKALAEVRKDYPLQFRVIGAGPLEISLHSLAADLGFNNEIIWLGMQPHRRVIEELESSDILMQPSVTARNGDSEGGAPTIILEAQACGVPVISTSHADIPYITRPNESALLSEERDVDGLANNLRHLFHYPELWSKMGKMGRTHVEKNHDVRKEVLALENLYRHFSCSRALRRHFDWRS
jgi:colanic acid/amylovoran biosynthesis glycosyltransferase